MLSRRFNRSKWFASRNQVAPAPEPPATIQGTGAPPLPQAGFYAAPDDNGEDWGEDEIAVREQLFYRTFRAFMREARESVFEALWLHQNIRHLLPDSE